LVDVACGIDPFTWGIVAQLHAVEGRTLPLGACCSALVESLEFHDASVIEWHARDGRDDIEAVETDTGISRERLREVERARAGVRIPGAQQIGLVAGNERAKTRAHERFRGGGRCPVVVLLTAFAEAYSCATGSAKIR